MPLRSADFLRKKGRFGAFSRFDIHQLDDMLQRIDFRRRFLAAGIHLLISAAIAGAAAVLVFWLWYPGPFRRLAGGRDLFLLVTSVDVVLGPFLTLAVFDIAKGTAHLHRDLAVIALIQAAALVYGLHTVYVVRPVAMVFEVDRFRLVTAQDLTVEELAKGPPEYRTLPTTGPWLLGTRAPERGAEHNDALFTALNGLDIGYRPLFWQPYAKSAANAIERSKPLPQLLEHYPHRGDDLRLRLRVLGTDEASSRFLPTIARGDWVAVIDKSGAVLGYLPVDGFF